MKLSNGIRGLLLSIAMVASSTAFAQVNFSIVIAPPAPLYEPAPVIAPGYVWAPGYWAWHGERHVWVHGRTIVQRVGYRWEPDVWEQRNNTYYRHPGRWERNADYRFVKMKKPKMAKNWDRDGDDGKPGNGKGGKGGKGSKGDKHGA